jgi:tRNA A37 threonylcarbamoyladenosine modification protein TsaB
MNKLIIDVANEKIFLMIITSNDIYNITKENTKINYEKLTLIINNFLNSNNLEIRDISTIYVNRGPGSFAGIRNSLSIVKAFNVSKKIDYYCFSFEDFRGEIDIKYENIPNLCDKFKIKKNLINPLYLS